tara:strand:- start:2212 stop:2796 length:585 start_codon:yes stop_codon:yes gene_type:complete
MKQYLQFNQETGDPIGVGPNKEGSCIEIAVTLANEIKDGAKQLNQYKVLLDEKTKNYVLNEIRLDNNLAEKFIAEVPASKVIYQLPVSTVQQEGINLIQNIDKGTWTASIKGDTLNAIQGLADSNKNLQQLFYITEEDNPNILHDTLTVDLNKLADEGEYELKTFDKQSVKLNISVYCRNIYNDYSHVRQNGQI